MKKLVTAAALVAGMFSANTFANSVSCYVDTRAYDTPSEGFCTGGETFPGFDPKVAFEVNTNKNVSRVDWYFRGTYKSDNNCSGEHCVVDVYAMEGRVTGCVDKIYYTDYTWEDVNWCAEAEYYYTDGGVRN